MENSKISDAVITLSLLYELLLNIGKSFDLQKNAEEFLKILMAQNNLSFAAYYTIEDSATLSKVHSIPKNGLKNYDLNSDLSHVFKKEKFSVIVNTDLSFRHIANLADRVYNEFAVFFGGKKSIIILGKRLEPFDDQILVKYEMVLNHFGFFMESLESHHLIKEEIKIKEEQAVIIEKNNEKLTKQNDDLLNYIRSNNELEQFAYRVSHDLNSPLITIIEFAKLLKNQKEESLSEKQSTYLKYILAGGNQMKELITGILDYSKITGASLILKHIDVQVLIEKVRQLLYHNLNDANGTIIVGELPEYIVADKTKMTQIFLNLFSNALKFKKENVDAEITVSGKKNDTNFAFSIIDNGIGIPKESQDKIFDLFSKAQNNTNFNGHGIGLNTCRQIIEQHEGEIWIEPEPKQGTIFHFTIKKFNMETLLP